MLKKRGGACRQRTLYSRVTAKTSTNTGDPQTSAGGNEYQNAARTLYGKDVKTKAEVNYIQNRVTRNIFIWPHLFMCLRTDILYYTSHDS